MASQYHRLIGGRVIHTEVLDQFAADFKEHGWRFVERNYSNRTDTLNQMMALAGLKPKRKMRDEMV